MTKLINWHVSANEHDLIVAIARKALADLKGYPDDQRTLIMDLTATHANGTPLKLRELLTAEPFDFAHDIYGIRKHINRQTGELEDCFLPRYAA